jgi:hypothetical protein
VAGRAGASPAGYSPTQVRGGVCVSAQVGAASSTRGDHELEREDVWFVVHSHGGRSSRGRELAPARTGESWQATEGDLERAGGWVVVCPRPGAREEELGPRGGGKCVMGGAFLVGKMRRWWRIFSSGSGRWRACRGPCRRQSRTHRTPRGRRGFSGPDDGPSGISFAASRSLGPAKRSAKTPTPPARDAARRRSGCLSLRHPRSTRRRSLSSSSSTWSGTPARTS